MTQKLCLEFNKTIGRIRKSGAPKRGKKRLHLATVLSVSICFISQATAGNCEKLSQSADHDLRICESKLKVLKLYGSPVKRAETLGHLLKNGDLNWQAYDYFNTKVSKVLETSPSLVKTLAESLYANYAHRSFERLPENYQKEVEVLAESSGKKLSYFKKAFALPDFGTAAEGFGDYLNELKRNLGCTSIGLVNPDGFMEFGRNLDFSGVGVFDENPIVVVNIPEEASSEIPHIAFGAEGMHYGSVSGVNAKGIGVVVHLNVMKDGIRKMNMNMYFVGEEVLRKARSLDEAISVLNNFRTGPQWAYVLTDFNTGEMAVVEVSKDRFFVRRSKNGIIAQSNHVANPDALKDQVAPFAFLKNSYFRKNFAELSALQLSKREHNFSEFLDILGYQRDPSGHMSSHSDVMKAHTIQSVAFSGIKGSGIEKVHLGFDPSPTATGRFGSFSSQELYAFGVNDELSMEVLRPSKVYDQKRFNQSQISKAYEDVSEKRNLPSAISRIKDHRTGEGFLFRAAMFYKLKLYEESLGELQKIPVEASDLELGRRNVPIGIDGEASAQMVDDSRTPASELESLDLKFGESRHIEESADHLKALALLQLKQTAEARGVAAGRLKSHIENPYLKKRFEDISKLKDGKKLSSMKVSYDFFSGDVE